MTAHRGAGVAAEVRSPAPRTVWHELSASDPAAMPTQSPAWTDCLCAYAPYHDASRFYRFANGQEIVMPMVRRRMTAGAFAVAASFPFAWGYGGFLSRRPVMQDELRTVAIDIGRAGFSFRLFANPTQAAFWRDAMPARAEATARRAHVLDLTGGFGTVWDKRFLGKSRGKVRKAERLGVEVRGSSSEAAASVFYELYRMSLERWADQQNEPHWLARRRAALRDPRAKILHIARFMGEACRIWVATHEGRPAAAIVVLVDRNADYILGAMDKAVAGPINANDLLQARAIEDACRAGCRTYHLGESGLSEGLAQFKERFGAVPVDYEEYRLERLPLSRVDRFARRIVKSAIGFKD